jgi:hypothetical protein
MLITIIPNIAPKFTIGYLFQKFFVCLLQAHHILVHNLYYSQDFKTNRQIMCSSHEVLSLQLLYSIYSPIFIEFFINMLHRLHNIIFFHQTTHFHLIVNVIARLNILFLKASSSSILFSIILIVANNSLKTISALPQKFVLFVAFLF